MTTITTVEELEALPERSVVIDADGHLCWRIEDYFVFVKTLTWACEMGPMATDELPLPAVVPYRPDQEPTKSAAQQLLRDIFQEPTEDMREAVALMVEPHLNLTGMPANSRMPVAHYSCPCGNKTPLPDDFNDMSTRGLHVADALLAEFTIERKVP